MSTLSDTTNLSPAVAGSDLFSHNRYLSYTAFPSILICLVLFLFLGLSNYSNISQTNSTLISNAISEKFYLSPILFFVPLFVIFLIYKKTKALPSLFCGTLLGVIFALIFQPDLVKEVSGINDSNFKSLFVGIMKSLYGTISISTSNEIVNELLTSGGMFGMLSTIWLIFSAMIFGGVMEVSGFLKKIVNTILTSVKSTGSLVSSTVGTCVFFNLTASDQYLSIVVPGRMFSETYRKNGLDPVNLSRTLEDGGTVTSVLVPWNTCGAYHATVLNVSTLTYLPYCFFSIISPLMTILFAYLKIKIKKLK